MAASDALQSPDQSNVVAARPHPTKKVTQHSGDPVPPAVYQLLVMAVHTSCELLDTEKFAEWLEMLTPDAQYRISAFSPEIRKTMVWLDLDKAELEALLSKVHHHVRDPSSRMRFPVVVRAVWNDAGRIETTSNVSVYRTTISGHSSLYCLAKYKDEWVLDEESPKLSQRQVLLETRELDAGSHLPI